MQDRLKSYLPDVTTTKIVVGTGCALGFMGLSCYRVARPGTWLVRTGAFMSSKSGMHVMTRGFVLPKIHTLTEIPVQPFSTHFKLKCLSEQYLPFILPVDAAYSVFLPTDHGVEEEGKHVTGNELFTRYVQRLHFLSDHERSALIENILHGQIRILASKLPIDAMNDNRDEFKSAVLVKVQEALNLYGVHLDAANISEIVEDDRNGKMGYLQAREQKKLTDTVQQSEIAVSEATKMGDIGKKQREADTRQEKSRLEAKTKQEELRNLQDIAKAEADLATVQAEAKRRTEISQIEANAAALTRKAELQTLAEEKKAEERIAAQRAQDLSHTKVQAEIAKQAAIGRLEAANLDAEAVAYAIKAKAMAERFAQEEQAQGHLALAQAEANGKLAMAVGTKHENQTRC